MTKSKFGALSSFSRLSPRRERFARSYFRMGNARAAAVAAGFSPRSARQIGSKLLKNKEIRESIAALRGATNTPPKTELSTRWVIEQLLEEVNDPSPKIRLTAKVAILRALTALGPELGEPECPRCAEIDRQVEGLTTDQKWLVAAGTAEDEIGSLSPAEFEGWVRRMRDRAESFVEAGRRVRQEGGGQHLGRDRGSEPPSRPST